ncbi:hypothetical protein FHS27_006476 [Rhodopirellula rubra]|uniref:Uncharacterized protein n=1 Tax=Aporhodopirellula rubra TaxID=980271 RepID=A0A7W5E6S8_9BACT|nr:hypothetical protein [Aporhodopirellula rubra]
MEPKNLREGLVCRIVHLDTPASNSLSTAQNTHFRLNGGVMLNPVAAIAVWDRMLALPHGDQMRCHTPRYAICLNFDDGRFYNAAICWDCNNISVSTSGEYSWRTFDAKSEAAQSLLAYIRDLVPDDDTET